MGRPRVSDEHKKMMNRVRQKRWRDNNPKRADELRMRYYVKKAMKLMQQQSETEREGETP